MSVWAGLPAWRTPVGGEGNRPFRGDVLPMTQLAKGDEAPLGLILHVAALFCAVSTAADLLGAEDIASALMRMARQLAWAFVIAGFASGAATAAAKWLFTRDFEEFAMDWDRISGNWKQFTGRLKEQWGKLTDDDITQLDGSREQLEGKIQERYGYGKDQARQEIDNWTRRLD
jgi:uncharacterized protein YjbJ (UPF0337 family)